MANSGSVFIWRKVLTTQPYNMLTLNMLDLTTKGLDYILNVLMNISDLSVDFVCDVFNFDMIFLNTLFCSKC